MLVAVSTVAIPLLASEAGFEWGKRQLISMLKYGSGDIRADFSVVADASCNFTVGGPYTEEIRNPRTGRFERDCFLARYSPAQTLIWGMVLSNAWTMLATTAPGGDILVAGAFTSAVRIGSADFTSRGQADLFLARCDSSGHFRWARHAGGTGSDYPVAVAANSSGECFVIG